ncbi:hypothetical protein D8B22_20520 [Verminephrobacter aporrectodeae subsp. tuberculatae]|nr:hypothetical protein [Verminephrobacter aporrectodeae subsp. tuberculatae]
MAARSACSSRLRSAAPVAEGKTNQLHHHVPGEAGQGRGVDGGVRRVHQARLQRRQHAVQAAAVLRAQVLEIEQGVIPTCMVANTLGRLKTMSAGSLSACQIPRADSPRSAIPGRVGGSSSFRVETNMHNSRW